MPHTASAAKRLRQNAGRVLANRSVKSAVRTAVQKAQSGLKSDQAQALLREAVRQIDKAVSKGALHRNTAARRKSALMRLAASAPKP